MSDDTIKDALKMMPYGFYAFTTKHGDDVNAMVVNWVSQMSYAPRLLAVGIQKSCYSHGLVSAGQVFGLNHLSASRFRCHHGRHQRPRQETGEDGKRLIQPRASNRRARAGWRRSLYRVQSHSDRRCRRRSRYRGRRAHQCRDHENSIATRSAVADRTRLELRRLTNHHRIL